MALVVDAGCLLAYVDADEPRHQDVTNIIRAERGTLVTTEFVAAEAAYLILARLGLDVELAFLRDLAEGTFVVDCLDRRELEQAGDVVGGYRDLRLGLADASLVVLAARYATTRILTFDERAFRVVSPLQVGTFMVLPADADQQASR